MEHGTTRVGQTSATDHTAYRFGGVRSVRSNGTSTSIVTLSRATLERTQFSQGERVTLHVSTEPTGCIRIDRWDQTHPHFRANTDWRDAGVRKVRQNGSSSVVTLPNLAMDYTAIREGDALAQYARSDGLVLVPDRPDQQLPNELEAYLQQEWDDV